MIKTMKIIGNIMKLQEAGTVIFCVFIGVVAMYNIVLRVKPGLIEPDNAIEELVEPVIAEVIGEDPETFDMSKDSPE